MVIMIKRSALSVMEMTLNVLCRPAVLSVEEKSPHLPHQPNVHPVQAAIAVAVINKVRFCSESVLDMMRINSLMAAG